ncbi:serine/arginine repetitive matrix protein 3-like [Bactrocera neohumeralis]|uniref:serine/arginine repetitive matrix protein 3-like n=1 Tax=Bactrocera neohumeralis TaxID=98809 RepID=UPI002166268C|nr:serine/arginine repetitive matrix protein 3-like [Bactrocera neohumeralis]
MSCRCILCQRDVSAGKQPTHQVHWTPRNPDEDIQRQRHQFRRRRSQAARIEGGVSGNGSRTEEIRSRRRVQLHLYTTAGAALRRIMGSRGEVRQTPHRSGNRQRATHSRGVSNSVGRSGGHPQLSPPSTSEPRSQRRRGVNTSASINRMLPAGITPREGASGPSSLLREMATCLLSQATVLATVVQSIPDGPSGAQQVAAPQTQYAAQRPRSRPRGQRAAAAVGTRARRRNRRRARRQGASRRSSNQDGHD